MNYKTEDNVLSAFGGESKANRRYVIFAEKAEKEGYPQVARLFRAVAEAENVHARNHLNAVDSIGTTKDNLFAASLGEQEEYKRMYPNFIEIADRERNDRAKRSFEWANKVEEIHHGYFEEALKAVRADKQLEEVTYYVCQVCGNTIKGQPPEKCPICGASASAFKEVE
ncbi:MAG TPA: rubrerythrin family protein [Dehalococcoidia bacterium]|nr:rubrerythrin family protein [Dehalococcoidia bacterium]